MLFAVEEVRCDSPCQEFTEKAEGMIGIAVDSS